MIAKKGIMLAECDNPINDYKYSTGEEVLIVSLNEFPDSYALYHETGVLDWIPKYLVKLK